MRHCGAKRKEKQIFWQLFGNVESHDDLKRIRTATPTMLGGQLVHRLPGTSSQGGDLIEVGAVNQIGAQQCSTTHAPNPDLKEYDQPPPRSNNRQMTFDAIVRTFCCGSLCIAKTGSASLLKRPSIFRFSGDSVSTDFIAS